ncbi:MAG: cytochrome c [Alphaproteobacteria bacterium]|nr:cytochrome c [Alphaproteobacteria bacterium]
MLFGGGQLGAQALNPQSSQQLNQSNQASAFERPSGMAAQWMKVPVVNITPGGVNVRPKIENPVANDPSSLERGMRYFVQFNCVGCHAPNGGGGMGPALSNRFFKYGGEPANIFLTISHGRPLGMPSWGAFLPDEVIWDLVSYIKSISDAPVPEWGHTTSPQSPDIQQIPAQFQQTATPWKFTQPFSHGQKPTEQTPTGQ